MNPRTSGHRPLSGSGSNGALRARRNPPLVRLIRQYCAIYAELYRWALRSPWLAWLFSAAFWPGSRLMNDLATLRELLRPV